MKGVWQFHLQIPQLESKQGERLNLCHYISLFSFSLLENMLLSLPPGEICCLSQFLSFLMEFHPLPYRWIVAIPLSICFTCSSMIPSPKVASFLLYALGISGSFSTQLYLPTESFISYHTCNLFSVWIDMERMFLFKL